MDIILTRQSRHELEIIEILRYSDIALYRFGCDAVFISHCHYELVDFPEQFAQRIAYILA